MESNVTICGKPKENFHLLGTRNVIPGYLKNCITIVLTALLVLSIWVAPTVAYELCLETGDCLACHPNTQEPEKDNWKPIHKDSEHPATITSGPVVAVPARFILVGQSWRLPKAAPAAGVTIGLIPKKECL